MAKVKEKQEAPILRGGEFAVISLDSIVANTAQSRGYGVVGNLQSRGYGLFDSPTKGKTPLWEQLLSDDEDVRRNALVLFNESEIDLVHLAESLEQSGMLQPIGVVKTGDDEYDVTFGMRRAIAAAISWASNPERPKTIEAKVFEGPISERDLILMALAENDDRKEESPIDRALTYKKLKKQCGMSLRDMESSIGVSKSTIENHLKLLDKELEDRRADIHAGSLSVDAALKLLKRRESEGEAAEPGKETSAEKKFRLPSMKKLERLYFQGYKDEDMSDEEWAFYTSDDVRDFLSFYCGFKKEAFVEKEKPAPVEKEKKKKKLAVSEEKARKLLVNLGEKKARTLKKEKVVTMLNDIKSVTGDDEVPEIESESLQKLYDKLLTGDYVAELKAKEE